MVKNAPFLLLVLFRVRRGSRLRGPAGAVISSANYSRERDEILKWHPLVESRLSP